MYVQHMHTFGTTPTHLCTSTFYFFGRDFLLLIKLSMRSHNFLSHHMLVATEDGKGPSTNRSRKDNVGGRFEELSQRYFSTTCSSIAATKILDSSTLLLLSSFLPGVANDCHVWIRRSRYVRMTSKGK